MKKQNLVLGKSPIDVIKGVGDAFPVWFEKLNLVVGLTALGFATIAFKSARPELYGWLFFIIIWVLCFPSG
jgi:hypothetical protein